jgi:peroxiredoxin Q/BCP
MFSSVSESLQIGHSIPNIEYVDEEGLTGQLSDLLQAKTTVVFFYPKANTPGCIAQACSLRNAYQELQSKGIQVIGVSADKPKSQKKFKEKQKLPYKLIADSEKKVIRAFGVPTFFGKAKRQAFLVRNGIIVWKDSKASTRQQAQDILKALAELS